jgi:iron complex outermembrane receptor protein
LASSAAPVIALALGTPAHAQSGAPASGTIMERPGSGPSTGAATATRADDAKPAGGLEEILVTARRTSESQQTVPVAVTALSSEALLTKQVAQVTDLARATPALSIGSGGTGPSSIVYLAIRGQAQNSPNSFSDASVGIYIDGIYVGRPLVGNLGFLDMASAEVLRGPQGTLFGRNTTGGALNITTNAPTNEFEGYVKAGAGNYDSRVLEGVINVPLSETLSTRFAGRYDEHDGYYKNFFSKRRDGGVDSDWYGRGSIKWEPKELPIEWTLSGDYYRLRGTGNGTALAAINPNGALASLYAAAQAGVPGFEDFITIDGPDRGRPLTDYINPEFAGSTAPGNWRQVYNVNGTGTRAIDRTATATTAWSGTSNLVIDLDPVTIKSITGYRKSHAASNLNLTGTPTAAGGFVTRYNQHQFSEELQVSGDMGALRWVAGGNYFREAGDEASNSAIFYGVPSIGGGTFNNSLGSFVSKSVGVFAQVNYNITDALRVTGGIRYTWDKRHINRQATVDFRAQDQICGTGPNIGLPASVAPCNDPEDAKFDYPAWLASVDYRVTEGIFVYAKTSGASMSGGFNNRAVPPPYSASFKPEDVRDVELGFKGDFLDRKLRVNLAAFHAWQSGVQRIVNTTFVDSAGRTQLTQFVTNAGDAKTYGLEFEGTLIPWRGMTVDASAAYLHARYKKGSRFENQLIPDLSTADPLDTATVSVDRSGEPITQAPKWTANIGLTQEFEFDAGTLRLHADYSYIASRYFDYFTTGDPAQAGAVAVANDSSRVRAYGLYNAQAIFALKNPNVEIAVWAKNLTNKAYFTNVFNSYTGIGATVQNLGVPRTFGATVAFHF